MPKKQKTERKKEVSSSPEKLKGKDYLRELERLHDALNLLSRRGGGDGRRPERTHGGRDGTTPNDVRREGKLADP
jgi:hypothetical protein